jgi:hypothetical protein
MEVLKKLAQPLPKDDELHENVEWKEALKI